ncbi:diacylglycerol kinase catalytic region [Catenulispora acidiphila DSM 44928]|uniref:Diacylglycerol kinase catalytic region n=1 Tax=Catenulispora acidiphila (strain DSM 44928 / JCM 14897 / NBRC 102108 / NRRL B-24433 / ID139908) TaxID=479433 RepID=C7Q8Z2_CATAD|nr:diacylglycerol kinase family protein [Catenulispora acidiphila]ACU72312.1 diacylglycerol kinase catalytic region [Catenulispora acidiphila DSM 44928]
MNQVAIVVHEGKLAALHGEDPCDQLRWALRARGEPAPKLYPTSDSDAGGQAVRKALAEGARLVVVCGGDGTVSSCAAALAGTGVPMAVIPIGTGNLVARNLGIPADPTVAVGVAVSGVDRAVDVGRLGDMPDDASDGASGTSDGTSKGAVMVGMAGVGLDAAMVQDAPHGLKRRIGWPAYVISLLRHLADRGFAVEIDVDGKRTSHRHVRTVVIGNVGGLHAGLSLFPDAQPDNGVLEVAVLAPRTVLGWIPVTARLLRGRDRPPVIARARGRHIVVSGQSVLRREADGEALADGRVLDVTVEPGALLLRVAAETSADAQG